MTVGTYKNTLNRQSTYLAYTFDYEVLGVSTGLSVGAISGYQRKKVGKTIRGTTNSVLSPMLAPSVALPGALGVTPRLSYIPGVGNSASVFHLSFEHKF